MPKADARTTADFVDAFFAELQHCGVRDVVVSPGSRSTPLACKALERFDNLFVDVDERGAAFFALGLAKAQARPVAVICTSGSAVGNWMPAVLEAEASRVPLLLLSGDRPPRLQGVGAPQTCDQTDLFAGHVRRFIQMPLPAADDETLDFARQMALEACVAAHGAAPGRPASDGGPVHVNFPFEEPLLPAKGIAPAEHELPASVVTEFGMAPRDAAGILGVVAGKRTVAVCGEGTCTCDDDADVLLDFARRRRIPLLADPLSGLRSYTDPLIIDAYDAICGHGADPKIEVVIRFGRWPVSKRLTTTIDRQRPLQIAVDLRETRDWLAATDLFVRGTAPDFCHAIGRLRVTGTADAGATRDWTRLNEEARLACADILHKPEADVLEGAYITQLLEDIPDGALLFSANSMSIRALDTFYAAGKPLRLLCNRGLNGIDGTLSSALGAAQASGRGSTLIVGDLAFLHDVNALALQRELKMHDARRGSAGSLVVVCLNNDGGAIFDMLPQKSDEPWFERLFSTPQGVDFGHAAAAFDVPYAGVSTVGDFHMAYQRALDVPGISVIDIAVPREGVAKRYAPFWQVNGA